MVFSRAISIHALFVFPLGAFVYFHQIDKMRYKIFCLFPIYTSISWLYVAAPRGMNICARCLASLFVKVDCQVPPAKINICLIGSSCGTFSTTATLLHCVFVLRASSQSRHFFLSPSGAYTYESINLDWLNCLPLIYLSGLL